MSEAKLKVLLVSIARRTKTVADGLSYTGILVERNPFELHVASDADFAEDLLVHTPLRLMYSIYRYRKPNLKV